MAIYITMKGECRSMKIEMDKLADGQKKKKHAPSSAKPLKARIVNARQSTKTKVIDLDLMKDHNYLTRTEATLTRIYPLMPKGGGKYEMNGEQAAVSIVMKLILKTDATNPMTPDWTNILWNITQQDNLLPQGCSVTFVRVMERVDDTIAQKKIKGRSNLALMTSDTYSNEGKRNRASIQGMMPGCWLPLTMVTVWWHSAPRRSSPPLTSWPWKKPWKRLRTT